MEKLRNSFLKKLIIYGYIFLSIFMQPLLAAGVVKDQSRNQQVNVEKAPNGVPVVNINAPNKNGVSHNHFKEYNVGKEGILLNNSSKEFNKTQIGGIIQGNSNLNGREANVILTEVTGVNRSRIEGYTEIVGKSAEYILANPNGIYLNGAGFINTPRVILTTGKSITDELGNLKGFSIDDGTVVIGSQGIDGKNVRMVDIISRTAELNGAVYGGEEVNVVLGRNDYDHQTKKVTPKADKAGDKPKVALDAKALGSLYAGRIYLQSTEKGVGVNSQGEMLAGAGDFEVDVNGRLVINDTQAKNDIKIKAENVEIQKRVIAENNVNVDTKDIINTGVVTANKNITVKSSNIENKGGISSKSININNKEKIVNTGKISADNVKISSKDMENKELTAVNADINLTGNLKTESIKAVENLNIKGKNIENTGTIAANKKVQIESADISNKGDISADEIKINNKNNVVNEKNITASIVDITSKSLVNKEEIQGEILNLKILDSFNNNGILLGKNITLNAGKVINTSTIYGEKYLTITADKYTNKNSGVTAGEILTLNSNIENDGNILGEKVIFTGTEIKNIGSITGEDTLHITSNLNNSGTIQGKNLVSITGNIDNSKNIKSEKVLNISGNVINTGYIYGENADIVGNITNSGDILSLSNMKISGNIINNKNLNSGDKLILLSSNILNNDRISALDLSVTGVRLVNKGMITGEKGIFNIDDIENYGTLYGKNTLSITGNNLINNKLIQGSKDLYINSQNIENKDDLFAGNNISLIAISLDNIGRIIGDGNLTFNTSNLFTSSNLIQGNNIKVTGIDNSGKIVAKEEIEAVEIKNNGTISALKNLKSNKLSNLLLGKTILGENLTLEEELLNKGIISVKGDMTAKNVSNTGSIISDKNIVLKELNNNSGTIEGKNINIVNIGILNNQSGKIKVFDNDSVLHVKALDINNNSGEIHAQGTVDLNIAGNLILTGSYIGNNLLKITANSLTSNINLENVGDIVVNLSGDFLNNNKFVSGNNITITAKDLINNKTLGSLGNFNIVLTGKLDNLDSIILGNGNNIITTAENVNNSGFLTSQNSLTVNSKDLVNNGQIASGNVLILNSNNITNNNFALLYSKENMFIAAKKDLVNNKGDIYSGNNVEIKVLEKVQNNAATIEAIGDIYIEAAQIENLGEVTGSHSITGKIPGISSDVDMGSIDKTILNNKSNLIMQELFTDYIGGIGSWTWYHGHASDLGVYLHEIDKVESNYTSTMAYISSGKNITLKTTGDVINREGNILADKDINISAVNLKNENYTVDVEVNSEWRRDYELHGSAMYTLPYDTYLMDGKVYNYNRDKGYVVVNDKIIQKLGTDKATKISAGNNINISAVKVGNGVLSSDPNVINDKNINVGQVILNNNNITKTGTINTESYITIPEGDKGLFVVNKDLVNSAGVSVTEKDKITVGNGELIFNNNSVLNNKIPGFSYLIESNVKFTDMGYYMGSDYFFGKIGFNPEKNIRLLGDAFYESRVVNRAILESTGKRYLNGAANEKEQMQILLDNSITAMEDFNLSIGTALTKEQINNLKSDIIWYVEEEVNGVNVLVPKVYLSKETLASLGNNQTGMMAGNGINISAVGINNTGSIKSNGSITINTEEFLNKSVLGDFKALIAGNDIEIVSVNDIKNIGAEISAENTVSLESIKGSIWNKSTARVNDLTYKIDSDIENTAKISGINISIKAGENYTNTAALVEGKGNVDIAAKEAVIDTIEMHDYEKQGGKKNYTITESYTNAGSVITGENISISADKNINIKGSDIVADSELRLKAGEDVNLTASIDSDYYEHQESKKKSFGRGKSKTEVKYSTSHNGTNLIGENVSIESGKDTVIIGSNIQAGPEGSAVINAGGDIVQAAVKDINYSYKKTTKTGFLGLTGSSKSTEQYKEEAVKSNTISGIGGTSYDAESGVLLEGVTVVSTGNITLKGKEIAINPVETQAYQEEIKKKKGFSSSFSGGTASFSYGKSKDEIKTTQTTNTASTIVSQGKVDIEATEGKAVLKSVDIYGETGIDIKGHEGVELIVAKDKTTVDEKHKSSSIGVSVGVAGSIKTTIDNVRDIDKLTDFGGNSYDIANTASDLVGAIKEGAEAFSKIKNDGQQENNGTHEGMKVISTDVNSYITVSAGVNKSKSEYHSSSESTVKNKLESKGDINISSGTGSVIIEGTDIKTEKDLNLSASKDVVVKSSKDEYSSSSSSSSKGLNADLTVSTNPKDMLGSVTASQSKGKGNSEGTVNVNSKFEVGGTHKVEAGEKVIYEGANVEAGRVEIKGEEVIIASSKDTEKSSSKNSNSSIKVTPGAPGFSAEVNVGHREGNGEKEWVSDQTSIIAKEGGIIESKDFTNSGAIIGSKSEENKLIVKAENITVEHLKDKDTNKVSGGGIEVTGTGVPNLSVVTGGQDKRQDTNATAVNTEFEIAGESKTAEELGFNTDLEKAQEITKDEDKVLDAELHTDLLNQSERDKIADLGVNLSEIIQSIVNSDSGGVLNTYKAHKYGRLLEAHINKDPRYKGLLGDPNISIEDKQRVLNAAVNTFLTSRGYAGPPLEILIGEESLSTRGKVVISKEKLNGLSFLEDLGHELGHLVSYDDGKEDTAKIVEGKLGTLEETDTQGKYNDYLESLKEEYKNLKTEEETKEWLANIPNNEKEYKFNQAIRSLALAWSQNPGGHQFGIMIPDDQNEFFENGTLKQKYKDMGYPEPEKIGDSYGWTLAGHSYKTKVQENGKEKNKNYLVVKFNETEDINSAKDLILNEANNTYKEKLNPNDLVISGKTDTEMIKQVFNSALNYQKNTENTPVNYKILGPNCNTWFFNLSESNNIQNNISDFGGGFADPGAKKELDQNLWKENGGKSGR
ncbi:two-partner secretion domain-containing protein [Fusobacterium ulcerans]|uniref:two-partner secretion domain-containing protein n=2 Tax=Fusobacterium TaxID=848 RepID=UPI002672276D|nr:hemagglutinin repeat-containing protein [Fusobacterium ulcerans]